MEPEAQKEFEAKLAANILQLNKGYNRFKIAVTIVTTIIVLVFIFWQSNTTVNKINQHMDCIVKLFAQPDRSELVITNPDKCTLHRN